MKRILMTAALALGACATAPAAKPTDAAKANVTASAPMMAADAKKEEAKGEECHEPGHTGMQPMASDAAGAIKAFDHKPQPGEKAICAVSGEAFVVTAETKTAEFNGKHYAFCCDNCEPDFKANPAKYAGN